MLYELLFKTSSQEIDCRTVPQLIVSDGMFACACVSLSKVRSSQHCVGCQVLLAQTFLARRRSGEFVIVLFREAPFSCCHPKTVDNEHTIGSSTPNSFFTTSFNDHNLLAEPGIIEHCLVVIRQRSHLQYH
jgi:hypothetical protein